jgi:abequosyltransferase
MNGASPILTIAIPTYNRRDPLLRTISALVPSLNESVRLIVIDNHSPYSVEDSINESISRNSNILFSFHRNVTNLGSGPNVLKCFELAETEWLWILGDDDLPMPDAINTILDCISEHPDAVNINFQSNILEHRGHKRSACSISPSLDHLADSLDCFSNLLFLSTNVYRREPMMSQLRIGYLQLQSWGPHVSMMLIGVNLRC